MRLTAEIDRRVRGSRCFGPRLTNIFEVVQQYVALGDIIIGGSQSIIACGVWTVVRMTFLVSLPSFTDYPRPLATNVSRRC